MMEKELPVLWDFHTSEVMGWMWPFGSSWTPGGLREPRNRGRGLLTGLLWQVGHEPLPPTVGRNVLGRKVLYLPGFFTYGE